MSHLVLIRRRLLIILGMDALETEVSEAAVHEVHHVVLAKRLRRFQQSNQTKVIRQFDNFYHLGRVRYRVQNIDISQVAVVNNLSESLVVNLLSEIYHDFLMFTSAL